MLNDLKEFKKIAIFGSPGSGKSTLSRHIGKYTGLPIFYLDKEHWEKDWKMKSIKEQEKRQIEICMQDRWIIDGNFSQTMEIRYSYADLVIFLDINRFICLFSIIKRRGKPREDLPYFLNEKNLSIKDTYRFYKYTLNYHKTGKPIVFSLQKKYYNTTFLYINSRAKANKIIKNIN